MRSVTRLRVLVVAGAALSSASAAWAHPGHGLGGGSAHWLHYVSDPLHAAPLALLAFTLALGWRRRRGSRARTR